MIAHVDSGVRQQPGDVGLGRRREVVLVAGVEECVGAAFEERLVDVHAASRLAVHGLGHEGRVHAVELGDLLDYQPVGHDVVGHLQRLVVAQVDLVLAGADLVVAVFDVDAEVLERSDGLLAQIDGEVSCGHVEVRAVVEQLGALIVREVVVLELRADVEGEAEIRSTLEHALEHIARISGIRRAVRAFDVAEHRRHERALIAPRQDLQGRGIGHRDHVGLLDACEALDRRSVEAHAFVHRGLEFVGRDHERLQEAENVGEPQVDELDLILADGLDGCGAWIVRHCHSCGRIFRRVFQNVSSVFRPMATIAETEPAAMSGEPH